MARAYVSTPIGGPLDDLARQLDEDRDHLSQAIDALGIRPGLLRNAAAAAGGRLGKMGLWEALAMLAERLSLPRADYEDLVRKAARQLEVIDQIHAAVRAAAFAGGDIS